jgi:pSer/pThr/pTyr-binding forkhead associated (FHA) protein
MPVKLIEPGPHAGEKRTILVTKDEFLIGRGADCDLRIKASAISRHHCLLRVRGQEVTVLDLGSSNGTFVNGQRVRSQTEVRNGDQLALGSCQFLVVVDAQGGVSWCTETAVDQNAVTQKLTDMQGALRPPPPGKKLHPPEGPAEHEAQGS